MSKYKYQKQFMFSIKRVEDVELFLEGEETVLDLPAIRDNHKNTVIHHTAYHNQPKVLECYLKYYRKKLERDGCTIAEIKTYTRYFLDEPNSEGYTAAHYAAYRGNISVIKLLEKYQAHFGLTNHLRMTMLHLAAQGDKPSTFLYLHQKKLNINQKDEKMTTPLHWASFAGAQKIVEYLVVQEGIQIDPVDIEGLTPLHLATIYGNSKIVKKLLISGANRKIKNNKGETALDIAKKKQFTGIIKMLNDKYSLWDKLKILCNAKTKYEPIQKSYRYPLTFIVFWFITVGVVFGCIQFKNIIYTVFQGVMFGIVFMLFLSLVCGGRKKQRNPHHYTQYALNTRFYHLCMVCVKEMRPREHHCPICKTCIAQYDHHCTWINNCVGKHNLARFNILLVTLQISLIWVAFISIQIILSLAISNDNQIFGVRNWVQQLHIPVYIATSLCLLPVLLFSIPLLCLILVQMKNLLLGKTTYQRFSRVNQSILTRQSSLLMNQPQSSPQFSFRNCVNMCCDEEVDKKQGENGSSTTQSFIKHH